MRSRKLSTIFRLPVRQDSRLTGRFMRYAAVSVANVTALLLGSSLAISAEPSRIDPNRDEKLNESRLQITTNVVIDKAVAYVTPTDSQVTLQLFDNDGWPISSRSEATITLVGPKGKPIVAEPDASGLITFKARPGIVAVVAVGPTGHAAIPVVIRPATDAPVGTRLKDPVPVPTFQMQPIKVKQSFAKFIPPAFATPAAALDSSVDPQIISSNRYRVHLSADGTLVGQILPLVVGDSPASLRGTNVIIHGEDVVVGRATVDDKGRFTVPKMAPGKYGLIAAGPSGYAAFAFEARRNKSLSTSGKKDADLSASNFLTNRSGETFVAMMAEASLEDSLITAISSGAILPVTPIPPQMFPSGAMSAGPTVGDMIGSGAGAVSGPGVSIVGSAGGSSGLGGLSQGAAAASTLGAIGPALANLGGFVTVTPVEETTQLPPGTP